MAAFSVAMDTVTASDTEAWREDLHFLAGEMVKVHPGPFHAVGREQFNAAVAELNRRIPLLTRDDIIVGMARLVALIHEGHTQMGLGRTGGKSEIKWLDSRVLACRSPLELAPQSFCSAPARVFAFNRT